MLKHQLQNNQQQMYEVIYTLLQGLKKYKNIKKKILIIILPMYPGVPLVSF